MYYIFNGSPEFFLDGPKEFILFAIMMAVMAYLRNIMDSVREVQKKQGGKKLQLRLLTVGLLIAMIEIFIIISRICLHAIAHYKSLNWNVFGNLDSGLFPILDFTILAILLLLYLYLAVLHLIYDIGPMIRVISGKGSAKNKEAESHCKVSVSWRTTRPARHRSGGQSRVFKLNPRFLRRYTSGKDVKLEVFIKGKP